MNGQAPRALIVVNAVAGGSPRAVADSVADQLGRVGFDRTELPTTRWGETVGRVTDTLRRALLRDEAFELVIAVGGDGTVRDVAEGIVRGTGRWPSNGRSTELVGRVAPALFVAPGGTGNSFYRALFVDIPVEEALRMILSDGHPGARIRSLDIGRLLERDQAVVLGASAGFLASVLDAASAAPRIKGRQRYEQAALELIGRPDTLGWDARVLVDGELLVEGRLLLVALGGARHRGGSFELLPRSLLDDGLFDVCAIRMTSPSRLTELLLAVVAGTHLEEPEVTYAKGHRVTIEALGGQTVPVELDGDVLDVRAPSKRTVTFEIIARVLPVWTSDPSLAG